MSTKKDLDRAAWSVDKDFYVEYSNCENVIEWIRNEKIITVCFSQKRFISRIKRLAEKFPDQITIKHENPDGSIIACLPLSALHINIRPERIMTEEQRNQAIERFSNPSLK